MKRLLKAAAALVCAFGFTLAHAQQTTITAASISMGGVPIAAGTVTFTPVNTSGIPIPFATGGGGLNAPTAFSGTLTAGAIDAGFQVPDACLTTPAHILYSVQITNTATQKSFTLQQVPNVCGTSWALDQYGPPASTTNVQTMQVVYGSGLPPSPCLTPSIYIRSSQGGQAYMCVGGKPVAIDGVTPLSGALADYRMLDGSGSTLTDDSGNGNNGTLGSGALAPTWVTSGLAFSGQQDVSLPAALNPSRTICITANIAPLTNAAPGAESFPLFMSASNGTSGLAFLYGSLNGSGTQIPGGYSLSLYTNNVTTAGNNTFAALHVYCATLGTGGGDLDRFYIDGVENSYGVHGSSAGKQTAGNLFLGSSNVAPWTASGLNGTLYRATYSSSEWSSTQVQSYSAATLQDLRRRNVYPVVLPSPPASIQLHAIGDSITEGYLDSTSWPANLSLTNQPSYQIINWGIGGAPAFALAASEPYRVAPTCITNSGASVAIVFAGTNDFMDPTPGGSNPTAAFVMGNITSEISTLKKSGCTVLVATMLSRSGSIHGSGMTFDAAKDALDALILQQAKKAGADGIVDMAAEPLIGADGAYSSSTNFNPDGIHPKDVMQIRMGAIASNSLNYYFGYTAANPHVVTATTYQMLSGDGAITAAPTANAVYTMPDCTGPSGESYIISNPQSTYTLTVTGGTNQPINGLTSAITIPSNSTVTLRDVANPKATSGCHWVM